MKQIPVAIQDFMALHYVSDPRFSPDGKKIAYLVTEISQEENAYRTDLWVYARASAGSTRLTQSGCVRDYFWADADTLIIWKTEHGSTTVCRLDAESASLTPLFTLPIAAKKIRPLSDGCFAITAVHDSQPEPARYHILDEAPFSSNGQHYTSGRRTALYVYEAASGNLRRLSDETADVDGFTYRAGTLIFQATPWQNYRPYPYSPAFYAYDVKRRETRQLTNVGRINSFALCFWKDDSLLFSGIENCPGKSMGQNSDFYTLDTGSGEIRRFADADMKIGYGGTGSDAKYGSGQGICLGPDGVYFLSPVMDGSCINRMLFDGSIEKNITEEDGFAGSIESFDLSVSSIVCAKMPRNGVAELYLDGRQITHFNDAYLQSHAISAPELFSFPARDGTMLHGFCMKPYGYMPGQRYPAILHIHGGPKTIFGDVFHHEMQLWASNGFFVFYCNPRGSDGRGKDFADIRGKWGTIDYTDIIDFTDAALHRYADIDASRVGVCGGSYGGFMVNWIIGHTNRFAAACAQRSFSNMINFEYLSDIGLTNIRSEHLGSCEQGVDALWNESPLKYAPNCNTPTLFIHSDEDWRCPLPDALEMFSCLKRAGCPARLCLFHGENHELSRSGRPDNRITRLQEILNWFKAYLQ